MIFFNDILEKMLKLRDELCGVFQKVKRKWYDFGIVIHTF